MIVLGTRNTINSKNPTEIIALLPYPFFIVISDGKIKMNGIGISFLYYSFFIGYSKVV